MDIIFFYSYNSLVLKRASKHSVLMIFFQRIDSYSAGKIKPHYSTSPWFQTGSVCIRFGNYHTWMLPMKKLKKKKKSFLFKKNVNRRKSEVWNWKTLFCLQDKYSTKSDVWSFAVVLWEILHLAKSRPFDGLIDHQVVENLSHMHADDGLYEYLPRPACSRDIYDLMRECWKRQESERPSFREIHLFLQRKNLGYAPAASWRSSGGGKRSESKDGWPFVLRENASYLPHRRGDTPNWIASACTHILYRRHCQHRRYIIIIIMWSRRIKTFIYLSGGMWTEDRRFRTEQNVKKTIRVLSLVREMRPICAFDVSISSNKTRAFTYMFWQSFLAFTTP